MEVIVIYLASPYSHPDPAVREKRFHAACRATAALLRRGMGVYSPIVHGHPLAGLGLPTTWDFWAMFDREHLLRCDRMVVLTLDGWQESKGVRAEMRLAAENGIPVSFMARIACGLVVGKSGPDGLPPYPRSM